MEQVCAPFWSEGEIERTPDRRDTRFGERVDQGPPLSDQRIYFRYLSDPRKSRHSQSVSQLFHGPTPNRDTRVVPEARLRAELYVGDSQ